MVYHEITPSAALQPYINCYWMIEDNNQTVLKDMSFPDGCVELIFNMGVPVFRAAGDHSYNKNPPVELIGQMSRPYAIQSQGRRSMLGIRFYPHTTRSFFPLQLSELTDEVVNPDSINKTYEVLYQKIYDQTNLYDQINAVEAFLLKQLDTTTGSRKFKIVDYAVKQILMNKSGSDLNAILKRCNISARYLQKLFDEYVGISPKMFMKIIRFQQSFKYLNDPGSSLTSVAYNCGYFDQSHFIRDFKSLSGTLPSQYLTDTHPYNEFFLREESRSYLFDY